MSIRTEEPEVCHYGKPFIEMGTPVYADNEPNEAWMAGYDDIDPNSTYWVARRREGVPKHTRVPTIYLDEDGEPNDIQPDDEFVGEWYHTVSYRYAPPPRFVTLSEAEDWLERTDRDLPEFASVEWQ